MRIQKPTDASRLIKAQRLTLGLTQQDIADVIGITRQSYARIENGHGGTSLDNFLKVFAALGLELQAGHPTQTTAAERGNDGEFDSTPGLAQTGITSVVEALRQLGAHSSRSAQTALYRSGAVDNLIPKISVNRLKGGPSPNLKNSQNHTEQLARSEEGIQDVQGA